MSGSRRAAVCGMPIAHSLSPVIHTAGYAAAGLLDWTYDAVACDAAGLPGLLDGLDEQWRGLSLTMPLKEAALGVAASASPVAVAVGAANTLVRGPDGSWHADNTDVPGMVRVLQDAGLTGGTSPPPTFTVLGGGGTARAALAAAARCGAVEVTVVTRRPEAVAELTPAADAVGVKLAGVTWADAAGAFAADAVISTVPKGVADHLSAAVDWQPGTVLFDVLYDPWPTPLASAAAARGVRIVSGLDLLLAQAIGQFEQFTGVPAPEAAMREALVAAAQVR
ncbi:shikimate dehydrogenase [Mangrovihabitans endophyticus]|uniref:Shikimate 5-dehydrogenase n=1 Tax=Mangrovihabitans endophyticus TaxID=1751298 RepID=A0A8J3FQZ5_9ACTN|nr:shikimate dehydrogenase [Mangrovihabitans endophyticus]GGL13497.1 shikimate 5-dehydrogenase [Mangrovihabitans endophyticus]